MLVRSSVKITVCLQKVRTKLTRFETNFKIENLFRLAELIQSTGVYRGARIKVKSLITLKITKYLLADGKNISGLYVINIK